MKNGTIDRGEVLRLLDLFYRDEIKWNDMLFQLMELPPAGGMSAVDFLDTVQRRCNEEKTPTYLQFVPDHSEHNFQWWVDQYIRWAEDHPVKKGPARTQVFLQKFPNARLGKNGVPTVCALDVFGGSLPAGVPICEPNNCRKCWEAPINE